MDEAIDFTLPFEDSTTGVDEGVTNPLYFSRRYLIAIHTAETLTDLFLSTGFPANPVSGPAPFKQPTALETSGKFLSISMA